MVGLQTTRRIDKPLGVALACVLVSSAVWADNQAELDVGSLLARAEAACVQQDTARLTAVSQQIQALAQQPALQGQAEYLRQLLALFEAGNCHPTEQQRLTPRARTGVTAPAAATPTHARVVQLSAGYLDNVNQGSRHERITFNSPLSGSPIEGTLDAKARPLSSPFAGIQGIYRVTAADGKSVSQAGVVRQVYTDEADFNTTGVFIGKQQALNAGREASAYLNLVRDDSGNMEGRVGGVYYRPLGEASEQHKTGVLSSLEYLTYPEQRAYEAAVANVALEHRQALAGGAEWGVRGRVEYDRSLNGRPGGDRREVELAAQWKGKTFAAGWQPTVGIRVAHKVDEKAFDPKLYGDSKRTQTRPRLDLGLSKPLGKDKKLYINYQYGRNQDSEVPLFDQPASSTLGITLETSF